ncbi:Chaperonin-like RbcX protein 2, chloroplastic [Sesamum angolense]|uniref:Chaperonin-like RbcX protein 2, chloroplastic n=1 Tax=Sesamum angolense TaxID=2727404 RepID=A0AAE1X9C2_9LAMI|nr:Chaperonin-like RbcX protein 2, chloroplastic [Sesamum angolense]
MLLANVVANVLRFNVCIDTNGCLDSSLAPLLRFLFHLMGNKMQHLSISADSVQILDYFTYKAVRTVLNQLYEMNPTQYRWLYNYVASNEHGYGKRFIRNLVKDKQDLAERVMVTRLHLYGKWVKKCDHTEMYERISDQNLELMRERLMETVIWPSDDTNTEVVG